MTVESRLSMKGERTGFFGEQKDVDTVVFVHGLRGHFAGTWGKFPELLATDADLPSLDIFLWGYRTGALHPLVADVTTVGGELMSELRVRMQSDNALHLVGHSLGGLVILHGLVSEMLGMRAQEAPTSRVSFVSLYACPVSGSSAAAVVRHTLGWLGILGSLVNRQVRSVARGREVDDLLTEVVDRMYAPERDDDSRRRIPIRMVMASLDKAVSDTDHNKTSARFRRSMPLAFDYGHRDIKEPTDHDDPRYRALWIDIQHGVAERFQRMCIDIDSGSQEEKEQAVAEFSRRYEGMLRRRLEDEGVDTEKNVARYRSFLRVVVQACARKPQAPCDVANRVLAVLVERGLGADG